MCFEIRSEGRRFFVEYEIVDDRTVVRVDGGRERIVRLEETTENGILSAYLDLDGGPRTVRVLDAKGPVLCLCVDGANMQFERTPMTELNSNPASRGNAIQGFPEFSQKKMQNASERSKKDPNALISPFPGKVIAIAATLGQRLSVGETILVVESMKMETKILAEKEATIVEILAAQGESIKKGQALVRFQ